MYIARMLETNRRHHHHRVAIEWPGARRTWGEVAQRAAALAGGLARRGIEPGDRVAVVSNNCAEILEAYYAAAGSGIVIAPVSTRLHAAELDAYFGEYLRPRAALLGPGSEPCLGGWIDSCEAVVQLPGGPRGEALDDVLRGGGALRTDVDPDAPFTIGSTSGTTGRPKGAVITQRNAYAAIVAYIAENPIEADDAYLIQHPMANVPGGPGQLFTLPKAARIVVLPHFDPVLCLETIERHRVTHAVLVPTMLHDLLQVPDRERYDTGSLRNVVIGAAPVPAPLLAEGVAAFGEIFRPMYGMTESTALACVLRSGDMYPAPANRPERLRSVGKPSATVELRVLDSEGVEVAEGGLGEIALRGDHVVRRYWGDIADNTSAWRDGWFLTGDMGTIDDEGFVTLVDRKKDIIISGGTNVAGPEVEDVLRRHPAVADVAVIGLQHPRWGEAVTAVVVLRSGATATDAELIAHARTLLGGPKVPKTVHFVDELPRNAMGKVTKAVLRERFE